MVACYRSIFSRETGHRVDSSRIVHASARAESKHCPVRVLRYLQLEILLPITVSMTPREWSEVVTKVGCTHRSFTFYRIQERGYCSNLQLVLLNHAMLLLNDDCRPLPSIPQLDISCTSEVASDRENEVADPHAACTAKAQTAHNISDELSWDR